MDLENLRLVLKPLVVGLKHRSHAEIPSIYQQLGLKEPPGPDLSKSQRMQAAFDETPDHELPAIGARYIKYFVWVRIFWSGEKLIDSAKLIGVDLS